MSVKNRGLMLSICLTLVWALGTSMPMLAQHATALTFRENPPVSALSLPERDLFKSEEVLRFKLLIDAKEVLKDRDDDRVYHKAAIEYKAQSGETVKVNLKVRVRGKHRRDPNICIFPPLMLNFPKKKVQHTIFAGENKLKLVTHCIGEKFVIREYLVYKLYNLVTPVSYRVRLCKVLYEDTQGNRKSDSSYAFLIEEDSSVAARNNMRVISDVPVIRMDATHNSTMAKLALFQYMIGNTDWSVPYRHNIRLMFSEAEGKPIPVPYDFDYTGIVMPPYAKPPAELGITSVRQRIFRGYTFPEEVYAELPRFYNSRKAAIYQVYQESDMLDKKYLKQTIKFLDEFYKTIDNPKSFEKQIVRKGQKNEKQNLIVKGID